MTFEEIKPYLDTLAATANFATIYTTVKTINQKVKVSTIKDIQNQPLIVQDVLTDCFLRKKVLWEKEKFETVSDCIASLIDLQKKCDEYSSKFLTLKNDTEYFLSQLMRKFATSCNLTYKELYDNKDNVGFDFMPVLKTLRTNCYKIIIVLTQTLPDGDLIKEDAFKKLDEGLKNSNINWKKVVPEWVIE